MRGGVAAVVPEEIGCFAWGSFRVVVTSIITLTWQLLLIPSKNCIEYNWTCAKFSIDLTPTS